MKSKDCLVQTVSKSLEDHWFPTIDGNAGRNLLQPAQAARPQQVGDLVLWITCWFGRYRSYVQTLHKDLYYQVIGLEISKNMMLFNITKKR